MAMQKELSNRKLLLVAGSGWMFDAMDVGILSFVIACTKGGLGFIRSGNGLDRQY